MPILYKCECGAAGISDESLAGSSVTCSVCGNAVQIPGESDPGCVLVFFTGCEEHGMALTVEEFGERVNSGQLTAEDLIWQDGAWHPVGEIYSVAAASAPPRESDLELAVHQKDLPPIQPSSGKADAVPTKAAKVPASEIGPAQIVPSWYKRYPALSILLQLAMVAVLLYVIWFCALGRIYNYVRIRPACVHINSFGDQIYRVKFNGEDNEMHPGSGVLFQDVYLNTGGRKSFVLRDVKTGKKVRTLKVPMYPDVETLYNTDKVAKYAIFDLVDVKKEKPLAPGLFPPLVDEIAAGKAPVSVFPILEALHKCATKRFQGFTQEEYYTSRQYQLDRVGVTKSIDYYERKHRQEAPESKLPSLIRATGSAPSTLDFGFEGCSTQINPCASNNPQLSASFSLPFGKKVVRPFDPEKVTETKGKKLTINPLRGTPRLTVRLDARQNPTIQFNIGGVVKYPPSTVSKPDYRGNWQCIIKRLPGDEEKWTWNWSFQASNATTAKHPKRDSLKLTYALDEKGGPKATFEYTPAK
ncbi:MAG: hypothetical protein IJJ33_08925 [Victivallales bacterium]|nr:hypothetical protein [Victivallales bacterium]